MSSPQQILFLPGVNGAGSFWEPASSLIEHPATRVFLDWPGLGDVPASPDISSYEDLVAMVRSHLTVPTAIVAQSMGGAVAIAATLRSPLVTHLVLVATSGGIDVTDLGASDWRIDYVGPSWALERPVSPNVEGISIPTLLVWASADAISPVAVGQKLLSLIKSSKLVVIDSNDHWVAREHAGEVAAMIAEHLSIG